MQRETAFPYHLGKCEMETDWVVEVLCDEEFIPEHRLPRGGKKESQTVHPVPSGASGSSTQHTPTTAPPTMLDGSGSKCVPTHLAQEAQSGGKPG